MAPDTMNLAEAAEYLKLGYIATKELFDSGTLPGVSLNQKHTVFLARISIRGSAKSPGVRRPNAAKVQSQPNASPRRARASDAG